TKVQDPVVVLAELPGHVAEEIPELSEGPFYVAGESTAVGLLETELQDGLGFGSVTVGRVLGQGMEGGGRSGIVAGFEEDVGEFHPACDYLRVVIAQDALRASGRPVQRAHRFVEAGFAHEAFRAAARA